MKGKMASMLAAFVGCAALLLASNPGFGQAYPNKPIRLIVPFPPGGSNDIIARAIGQKLTEKWSYQVVIDNRSGASGIVAAEIVAKAPADGYTIYLPGNNHAINASLYAKLPYDTVRDFTPITLVGSVTNMLVVHPSFPAKSVADLIAIAKSNPGRINYTGGSPGNPAHLAGELFKSMAGIEMVHIPYKGGAPALVDVLSGQVPILVTSMPTALPAVRTGALRALAITSAKRSRSAPEIPTIAEVALPGYEANAWYGVLAPAGTPRDIINILNSEIGRSLEAPDVRQRLHAQGIALASSTPEEFAAFIKDEMQKYERVVRERGIRIE